MQCGIVQTIQEIVQRSNFPVTRIAYLAYWDSAIVKYHPLPSLSYDICVVPESACFVQGDYLKNIDFFYGKKEKDGMRTRTI